MAIKHLIVSTALVALSSTTWADAHHLYCEGSEVTGNEQKHATHVTVELAPKSDEKADVIVRAAVEGEHQFTADISPALYHYSLESEGFSETEFRLNRQTLELKLSERIVFLHAVPMYKVFTGICSDYDPKI